MTTYTPKNFPIGKISPLINSLYQPGISLSADKLRDALSEGQLSSKLHLLNCLEKVKNSFHEIENTHYLACWHGLIAKWINEDNLIKVSKGNYLVDIDKEAVKLARQINFSVDYVGVVEDILFYKNYSSRDAIVNTSCEHFSYEWLENIPQGCLMILQSSNLEHCEHVNKETSLNDFAKNVNLRFIIHGDEILLSNGSTRFTLIGEK